MIGQLMLSTDLRNYVMFTEWIIPVESVKRVALINYKKDFPEKLENYKEYTGENINAKKNVSHCTL
jgi:hypothetical protein